MEAVLVFGFVGAAIEDVNDAVMVPVTKVRGPAHAHETSEHGAADAMVKAHANPHQETEHGRQIGAHGHIEFGRIGVDVAQRTDPAGDLSQNGHFGKHAGVDRCAVQHLVAHHGVESAGALPQQGPQHDQGAEAIRTLVFEQGPAPAGGALFAEEGRRIACR